MTTPALADSVAGLSEAISIATEDWARSWFLDSQGDDLFSFDGIPTGSALLVPIHQAVDSVVRRRLGLQPVKVGRTGFTPVRSAGLDRPARSLALRVMRLAVRSREMQRPVAFVSELATPSALASSMSTATYLARTEYLVGAADPRAARSWRGSGSDVVPVVVGQTRELLLARRARTILAERWSAFESKLPGLEVKGRDVSGEVHDAAQRVLSRSGPWLATEWAAVHDFLERASPRVIVLASDQHRIGRLVCQAAGAHSALTIVLQHGLPQSTLGYLPLHADRLVAWGDRSAHWFTERGVPAGRIVVLGNPRIDDLRDDLGSSGGAGIDGPARSSGPRLLLALSAAPSGTNEAVVAMALDALVVASTATLVIKTHPGGSDWSFLARLVSASSVSKRVRISSSESLRRVLRTTDVVLVHRSTVAIDAMAAGLPVVVIQADLPSATEDLRELRLPTATTGAELAAAIASLIDPVARSAFVAERQLEIRAHAGPVDGQAGRRIAEFIREAAGPVR